MNCNYFYVNNSNNILYIHDGPGELSPLLYDDSCCNDFSIHDDIVLNSSSFVIHVLLLSKSTSHLSTLSSELKWDKLDMLYQRLASEGDPDHFLTYTAFNIDLQHVDLPGKLVIPNKKCDPQHKTFVRCVYKFKVAYGLHVRATLHQLLYRGMFGYRCEYGGLAIFDWRNNTWKDIQLVCGQDYLQDLPHDLSQNVSFISSGTELLIVYVTHKFYSNLNILIDISSTTCKGFYLEQIFNLTAPKIVKHLKDFTIYISHKDCIQIQSTNQDRKWANGRIHFTCNESSCDKLDVGFKVEILQYYIYLNTRKDKSFSGIYNITHSQSSMGMYLLRTHIDRHQIGIEADVLEGPYDGIHIMYVEQHPCKVPCSLIDKSIPLKTCDICRQSYMTESNKTLTIDLQPNTCFRITPTLSNIQDIYHVTHNWRYSGSKELLRITWYNVSGIFQINSLASSSNSKMFFKARDSMLFVATYEQKVKSDFAEQKVMLSHIQITQCLGKCAQPLIMMTWSWHKFTYAVLRTKHKASWLQAESICKTLKGHLISLHGQEDLDMLRKVLYHLKTERADRERPSVKSYQREHQHLYYIGLKSQVSMCKLLVDTSDKCKINLHHQSYLLVSAFC